MRALLALAAGVGAAALVRRWWGSPAPAAAQASEPWATVPERPAGLTEAQIAAHRAARPIIEQAIKAATGAPGSLADIQYCQAVGSLETSYGRGWNDSRCPGGSASNNWGAVQAKGGEPSFPCTDSHPDGKRYSQPFRTYATPLDGATDMVRHVLVHRKAVAAALRSDGASILRVSYVMRRGVYYGGFCPDAVKRYGEGIAIPSYRTPDRDEGTRACAQEAIVMHAGVVARKMREIAFSLQEPMSLPMGSYDDAEAYYRATKGTQA